MDDDRSAGAAERPVGARPRRGRRARVLSALGWGALCLWLVAQVPVFTSLAARGIIAIDFLTYRRAADALVRGESPYASPEEGERICRDFHRAEQEIRAAAAVGQGREVLAGIGARPQQPGLYIYVPTLALLVAQLGVTGVGFAVLILLSILVFARVWLGAAAAGGWWLLLVMGSWEVLASWYGGNVELVLLCAALLAARLLWAGGTAGVLLASPLVALVLLIKPPFALYFAAFGLLHLLAQPREARATLRRQAGCAALATGFAALEVVRWGPALRAETLRYVLHAADYMCFGLPPAEQTPLSLWNRTPLQALVSAGVPYGVAQPAAYGLWLAFVAATLWRVWRVHSARRAAEAPQQAPQMEGAPDAFPVAFALALVLFYWGRPVGWVLAYLEVVVLVAAWPALRGWQRPALLGAAVALMASRWVALALTLRGEGLLLLTLQSAELPWETWLVLPASWLLLLWAWPAMAGATRVGVPSAPTDGASVSEGAAANAGGRYVAHR